ncbi:P-loop containing nucleoside triphosphate hydrolase protein [Clathrospora elynae]|uniref:P-loop containing nucleoside triphosphate hydrolase protein n=1 Tax=Clathrospora elynae TaxID=706981 RepID=A0A6A5T0K7_9PLEO|nr:P-loop containing nucleoside triphosphate hydrolase protein [Clathrospora elynae]
MVHDPGTLYVEVRLKNSTSGHYGGAKEARITVRKWILRHHTEVAVGMPLHLPSQLAKTIERADITGYSKSKQFPDLTFYKLAETNIEVVSYSLLTDSDAQSENSEDGHADDNSPTGQFESMSLPHQALDSIWESLIYADPIAELTLRTLIRAIKERHDVSSWRTASWQNTVLLHGPPGSGKTTLAQALAQRLSIRLSALLPSTKLLQVNAHALFSRFLGETAKQIGQLFKSVLEMALDDSQLTVVVFDEVETVAGSREKASQQNEPADTIRATNEILRGLDKCRKYSNIVFIFTTNLIGSLDSAFIDRCCIEKFISAPGTECVFGILRLQINQLIRKGLIGFDTLIYEKPPITSRDGASDPSAFEYSVQIPDRQWAQMHWPTNAITAVSELYRVATLASGLSGRKLKGLVTYARYEYLVDNPGDLRDLFVALEAVVREKTGQVKIGDGGQPDETAEMNSQTEGYESIDIAQFIAQLEANESG